MCKCFNLPQKATVSNTMHQLCLWERCQEPIVQRSTLVIVILVESGKFYIAPYIYCLQPLVRHTFRSCLFLLLAPTQNYQNIPGVCLNIYKGYKSKHLQDIVYSFHTHQKKHEQMWEKSRLHIY